MWPSKKFTDLIQIQHPIVQGPFGGGYSSVALAAAVTNCGGLGSYGAQSLTAAQIIETTGQIKQATNKPFAINLWVSDRDAAVADYKKKEYQKLINLFTPYFNLHNITAPVMPAELGPTYEEQLQAVLQAKPPVFSFVYGIPNKDILKECRKSNIKTIGAATTIDEAMALQEAGVDALVASGMEAGGHRVSFLKDADESLNSLSLLLQGIVKKVTVPVIAAGGITNGKEIAAALKLGAAAVQIGTAFLACDQSNASEIHKQILFTTATKHTVLTKVFTGRLARGINNEVSETFKHAAAQLAPFPIQAFFIKAIIATMVANGNNNSNIYWCGQHENQLRFKDAEQLFNALVQESIDNE